MPKERGRLMGTVITVLATLGVLRLLKYGAEIVWEWM